MTKELLRCSSLPVLVTLSIRNNDINKLPHHLRRRRVHELNRPSIIRFGEIVLFRKPGPPACQ